MTEHERNEPRNASSKRIDYSVNEYWKGLGKLDKISPYFLGLYVFEGAHHRNIKNMTLPQHCSVVMDPETPITPLTVPDDLGSCQALFEVFLPEGKNREKTVRASFTKLKDVLHTSHENEANLSVLNIQGLDRKPWIPTAPSSDVKISLLKLRNPEDHKKKYYLKISKVAGQNGLDFKELVTHPDFPQKTLSELVDSPLYGGYMRLRKRELSYLAGIVADLLNLFTIGNEVDGNYHHHPNITPRKSPKPSSFNFTSSLTADKPSQTLTINSGVIDSSEPNYDGYISSGNLLSPTLLFKPRNQTSNSSLFSEHYSSSKTPVTSQESREKRAKVLSVSDREDPSVADAIKYSQVPSGIQEFSTAFYLPQPLELKPIAVWVS